ncbi:MAG: glycosyltransferase family 2 protein, partial [Ilumatobacteraceae bacterium]
HFADPSIGGVQVRVRIYNRDVALTRAQDIEFGVYGLLYQAARSRMGTAGMGGNGQFNRLAALDDVASGHSGPWRDKLTEDQDIGLRMLEAGWRCGHDNRSSVHQQGVPSLRRLLRQRTRWMQGNLQAMGHLRRVPSYAVSRRARFDLTWGLLQPVAAAIVGFGVFAALLAFVTEGVPIVPGSVLVVLLFFVFGFGGVVLGVTARSGRGPRAWIRGLVVGIAYSAYTWLLWPVLIRATWRQIRAKGTWAKTEREAIDSAPAG